MSVHHHKILIVDDDTEICSLVMKHLQRSSYDAVVAHNGKQMMARLAKGGVDAIVLDLNLPDTDGLELCRKVRAEIDTPIIILTARGDPVDRIIGLELGADDYLAKPFEPRELVARIRSILRRTMRAEAAVGSDNASYSFNGWTLSVDHRALIDLDDRMISLSGAEYRLLRIFVDNPGVTLSREKLLDLGAGEFGASQDRAIDLQVSRLRSKLRRDATTEEFIKTVRHAGYCFDVEVISSQ